MTKVSKVSVFISYARADARIAEVLRDELIELNRDRVDCFLDTKTIEAGEEFESKIEAALKGADWLICVYTGEQSEYCGFEVGVFTGGKISEKDRESSRIVCIHDSANYPGIFRSHENIPIDYPPEPRVGEAFDESEFYNKSGLVKFLRDFAKYNGLYVAHEEAEFQRQSESFIRKAKSITEAFGASRENDVRSDTPTQLGFDIIVPNGSGEILQGIPPTALVKGTYETFRLFRKMPPLQNEQLPTVSWGSLKEACKDLPSGYLPWIGRLERDMLNAANGSTLVETDATFRGNDSTYRAILVRHILRFNGTHTFGVIFVKTLPSHFLGDHNTSMILAGLVVASRFRFAYLEQPERVAAWFSDKVSDSEFAAKYRQLLYDLERMREESLDLGLLDYTLFVQSFGPSRKAIAEEFLAQYNKARVKFEGSLPPIDTAIGSDIRPTIRSAIMTFLAEVEDQNSRFLEAALEAYQDELRDQLRKRKATVKKGELGAR